MKATYQLTDLVSACAMNDSSVQIRREAQKDAGSTLCLKPEALCLGL